MCQEGAGRCTEAKGIDGMCQSGKRQRQVWVTSPVGGKQEKRESVAGVGRKIGKPTHQHNPLCFQMRSHHLKPCYCPTF